MARDSEAELEARVWKAHALALERVLMEHDERMMQMRNKLYTLDQRHRELEAQFYHLANRIGKNSASRPHDASGHISHIGDFLDSGPYMRATPNQREYDLIEFRAAADSLRESMKIHTPVEFEFDFEASDEVNGMSIGQSFVDEVFPRRWAEDRKTIKLSDINVC